MALRKVGCLKSIHDLHPEFHSARFARSAAAIHRVSVQHHHAHVASVLAEHDCIDGRVIGVALDGTGYGTDGSICGGEFFVGSTADGFERVFSFRPVQMPGGDAAARFPVQAAAGFLADLDEEIPELTKPPFDMPPRLRSAMDLVKNNVRCFRSTSAGRLFDAVAAILGFVGESTFEGQAAIWLEMQARQAQRDRQYSFPNFDHRPLLSAILKDRVAGHGIGEIARGFHISLAKQLALQIVELCAHYHVSTAALSGGVFQNKLLFDLVHDELQDRRNLHLITNRIVPVNDGGLCLGQAAIACVGQLSST